MSEFRLDEATLRTLPRDKLLAIAEMVRRKKVGKIPGVKIDHSPFLRYRDKPVEFVRDVLGDDPWERQQEILQALVTQPRVTVRSCHGSGKTFTAARAVLWFVLTRPNSIVVTTAPTGRQVRDLLWRQIGNAFTRAKVQLPGRLLTTMLELDKNWYATGYTTDDPVRFQGVHSPEGVMVVGDEASGLPMWLFEAIEGTMTQEGSRLLLIGNPNQATGGFYESHRRWPAEQRFHISAFDVPERILRRDWAAEMLDRYGEDSPVYQVRVLGEFPTQSADQLISLTWIEAAQNRVCNKGEPIEIGVDIARFGGDESVAYVRAGNSIVAAEYWQGNDTMQSAGRVVALAKKWHPVRIKVDEIGVGSGVVDRLAEQQFPVVGVNVGAAANDRENYVRLRDEIFAGLAQRFREGEIMIPPGDTDLADQLTSLTMQFNSRGQRELVSKRELRKKGFGSPDRADALAICFAAVDTVAEELMGLVITGSVKGW